MGVGGRALLAILEIALGREVQVDRPAPTDLPDLLRAEPMLGDREPVLQAARDRLEELPEFAVGIGRVLVGLDPERAAEDVPLAQAAVVGHAEQVVQGSSATALAVLVEEAAGEVGDDRAARLAELADAAGLGVGERVAGRQYQDLVFGGIPRRIISS